MTRETNREVTRILQKDRLLSVQDLHELGEKHGLIDNQVAGQLAKLAKERIAFKAEFYASNQPLTDDGGKNMAKKIKDLNPYR